ncbi:MAG: AIM24 family protein, partial [Proteobacteria bacterium]
SELSEQNLEKSASKTSAEIPDISKPSSSNDLFATWDTDAAEEVAVDEVATDEVAEHEVVVNETSVNDTLVNDTLVNETLVAESVAQTPIADTSSNEILVQSTEAQVVDAISVEDSASSVKTAEDFDSACDAAASDATSASEETANNSIESIFAASEQIAERIEAGQQPVPELADLSAAEPSDELEDTVDAVAELEDDLIATAQTAKNEVVEAEAEAEAVAEADLSDLQWVEPVAQWQTVAELAEAGALEQPQAAVINSSVLSHASTDAIVGFDSGAGDFSDHNVFNDKSVEATRFDDEPSEPPTTWDESVEITQALTDRLAQIAEESKEDVNHKDDVSNEISATSAELETDASTTPEGVLLFEEADVTEISAADWDDWHPVEPYSAESGKRVFNPLLDFDQVEADWKNSPVELSFDAAGPVYSSDHHCGLTAENEQELAAFLGAADTYEPEDEIGSSNDGSVDRLENTEEYVNESEVTDEYLNARTADTVETSTLQATSCSSLDASEEFAAKESAIETPQGISKEVDAEGWAHEISVQANCGFLEVTIPKGKELHVAAAAAVTMGLSLHEQLQAGSGVRAWLLAKGFVINTYEAIESAGTVGITAITHGMVCAVDASDFPVMVQQNAYLASTDGVQLNADQSRLNPVVNACKWIHCSGAGELWLNAQGLWEMVEVDGCYRINSRYLMAFSKSLELKAPPLAGLKSYLTSGGGVECRLTGRGVVWVQTDASRAPVLWQKAS